MRNVLGIVALILTILVLAGILWLRFELPVGFTIAISIPVIVATLLLRWLFVIHKPSVLKRFMIPIGISGGIVGAFFGPLGFGFLIAFSNIPGASNAMAKVLSVLPFVVVFGITTSIVMEVFSPIEKGLNHNDETFDTEEIRR